MSNSTNNNAKRKEEILEISRKSKEDEGIDFAKKKSEKLGMFVVLTIVFSIAIPIFALRMSERVDLIFAMGAVVFGIVFAETFTTYRFAGKRTHLVWAIGMLIMALYSVTAILLSLFTDIRLFAFFG